jgi:hypothetical protein
MLIADVNANDPVGSQSIEIDFKRFDSQKMRRNGVAAEGIENEQIG